MRSRRFKFTNRKYPLQVILLVLVGLFLYFGLPKIVEPVYPQVPAATRAATGSLPPWLNVYFTNPSPPDQLDAGIDRVILPALEAATLRIDAASFDFNLPSVVNALANASRRGVRVRVVYDGANGSLNLNNAATSNKDFDTLAVLKAAGVDLVDGGRTNGLMHDKLIIVDGQTLFMGSWNLSYNDTFRNNNNLLKITDPGLIANYQARFDEMFEKGLFGTHARVKLPYPSQFIGGMQVENYMAPEDGVMEKLVQAVGSAQKSVHFMIYTYTHPGLASAMIARLRAGVEVQGVMEKRNAAQGVLADLFCSGLAVKVDGNSYIMHHKVIIIDGQTVITGSFNFTRAADTENDDNVLVIHSPAVAALYEQEYQKIYSQGTVLTSAEINCSK
jgi:phosphatidylserine/phosphatidylglycerophosphate/cardiolipin synthase-like enzyme